MVIGEQLLNMVSAQAKVSPHDTLVGAFIEYSKDGVLLELYENIEGKGVRTDVIELVYTQDAIVLFQP